MEKFQYKRRNLYDTSTTTNTKSRDDLFGIPDNE